LNLSAKALLAGNRKATPTRMRQAFTAYPPAFSVKSDFLTAHRWRQDGFGVGRAGRELGLSGTVQATQRVNLSFRVAGPLISLPVDEGQRVRATGPGLH
jgi:multidrug efflux pump subunit AcrA (membrane-fusion protein)